MGMSKRDYELIASVLRDARHEGREEFDAAYVGMMLRFANALAQTSSHFDKVTFLRACGYGVARVRRCPHGVQVGPLDDYGVPADSPVSSTYCKRCNPGRQ